MDDEFDSEFVEVDPTGRYGRYDLVLGKGASKTVYRGFDEYDGIEVAWNQVKLYDFLQSPEDLERLYCEIHLLKTLNHENIMKFYTSWVDVSNRNINFVTEMFTSGTLRQYRLKHRRVNIRAIKHWCRQILKGLLYLHSLNPPVIHRDLKCDNIFINGNQGEVKIGDLGLAAILRKSYAARCVGTPEFMAPEVYQEEYNELVDIYSFGMCILEMVTFEYPYSECTHPAQIYKKVVSGKKPDALFKIEDPEVREFIEKCIATVSDRLTASELLNDPFLQIDDLTTGDITEPAAAGIGRSLYNKQQNYSDLSNGYSEYHECEFGYDLDYEQGEFDHSEMEFFVSHDDDDDQFAEEEISIKGRRREDDGIFLRLRLVDKDGKIRNIYFPFDTTTDTAMSVADEMISELDLKDQNVTKIANMIDNEISSLVPNWTKGTNLVTIDSQSSICQHCVNAPVADNVSSTNVSVSKHGCPAVHGRFEEITYQVDGSPIVTSESDDAQLVESAATTSLADLKNDDRVVKKKLSAAYNYSENYENEIRQELRWLKAKYNLQLRELKDQQLRTSVLSTSSNSSPTSDIQDHRNCCTVDVQLCSEQLFTAKNFYNGGLMSQTLHRATSLPVDAVDV